MTRRALTAAVLAVVVAGAVTPLLAGRDSNKATYTCGTVPETRKQVEGRVNTWSLSVLDFTPDSRMAKPLRIPYKAITRIEYGRMPPTRVESQIKLPCGARWPENHVMIFYREVAADDEEENQDPLPSEKKRKEDKEKEKKAREDLTYPGRRERRERLEQKDLKDQRLERKAKEDRERGVEHFAAFELGDGMRRNTLKTLESRSGRRIFYQDAAARRSAR